LCLLSELILLTLSLANMQHGAVTGIKEPPPNKAQTVAEQSKMPVSSSHDAFLRLLGINALAGAGLAAAFVGALLWLDPQGLASLVARDQNPVIALLALVTSFMVTFASLMMASAVMLMSQDDKPPQGGGRHPLRLTPMNPSSYPDMAEARVRRHTRP
jgi:hypothetical protein